MPYYREDLQPSRCVIPGCDCTQRDDEIYFHSLCHPSSPTWARYRADVLTIECCVCQKEIAAVVVASRADEERTLEDGAPEDDERCP